MQNCIKNELELSFEEDKLFNKSKKNKKTFAFRFEIPKIDIFLQSQNENNESTITIVVSD
jgi:hypothetical protein